MTIKPDHRIGVRASLRRMSVIFLRARLPISVSALLLVLQAAGIVIGRAILVVRPSAQKPGIAEHLLSWDGRHYYEIMLHGYAWNPVQGLVLHHYQTIAFFPLQSIMDWIVALPTGKAAPTAILLLSLGFGIASIFAFDRLARTCLRPDAARWATALFGLWPASAFYVMGYPTGLISLCILAALANHLEGRFWRSALWCGIGSAAAPTLVFVVLALGIDRAWRWLRTGAPLGQVPSLIGWGLLCVSGLLGFMLFQAIRFHDPLAFTEAQVAWGAAPPMLERLDRLWDWHWYIQQSEAGTAEIRSGLARLYRVGGNAAASTSAIEDGIQRWINTIALMVTMVGLVIASIALRGRAFLIALAGWTVLAGYVWFIFTTNQNMLSVPRLVFPGIALFFGLGWGAARLRYGAGFVLLFLFGLASMAEVAFAAAGYWVV